LTDANRTSEPLAYVRRCYGVPANIGRMVTVGGRPGIITADGGAYIGVTFDDAPATSVLPCHPTSQVVYGEMGVPRPLTRSQKRYRDYLEVADVYESFHHYLTSHP
jgi:hypothetical protein